MADTTDKQTPKRGRDVDSSYNEQDRREQRNMEDSVPRDPKRPDTKPQGSTADQVANMENEGQAQDPVEPDKKDSTATTPPGHQKEKRTTL